MSAVDDLGWDVQDNTSGQYILDNPNWDMDMWPDSTDMVGTTQDGTIYFSDGSYVTPDGQVRWVGEFYPDSGGVGDAVGSPDQSSFFSNLLKGIFGGGYGTVGGAIGGLGGVGARMIGNNMVDKSIGRDINSMFDRLEGMSSLSPQQRQDLAGLAMQRYGRDYLDPETMGSLMERFNDPSYQDLIDASSGGLQTLYNDPMSNPIMQAVADRSLEAIARKSASAGHLGSGNFQDNMQQGLMAALEGQFSNLAQPMNQSFSAATGAQSQRQGQAAQMINALNGANQTMWGGANQMIDNANAPMQAASNLAPTALQAQMLTNPTRANMADFGTSRATNDFNWQQELINQGLSAIASNWNG